MKSCLAASCEVEGLPRGWVTTTSCHMVVMTTSPPGWLQYFCGTHLQTLLQTCATILLFSFPLLQEQNPWHLLPKPLTRHRTSNPCHHPPPGYREDRLASSTRLKHRGLLFFRQNTCFTSPSQKTPINRSGSPSQMTRKPETEEAMVSPLL